MGPHGSLPTSAYWRRRLLLLGVVALAALTGYVVFLAGGDRKHPSSQESTTSVARNSPNTSGAGSDSLDAPVTCVPAVLGVAAATSAASYRVGQRVDLAIQITNIGQRPCVVDLSDSQIELLVYNGASRVWGSHDCTVQPGHSPVTLAPRKPVKRTVSWTGLSSQPKCAGTRVRVGAGTYTLRASIGQASGRAATFSLR